MSRGRSVGCGLVAYGRAMAPADNAAQAVFRWRLLAIILTVLFFEKGNYWGLVAAAIGVTHLLNDAAGNRRRLVAAARGIVRRARAPGAVRALLLDRFIIAAALVLCLVVYLYQRGPTSTVLFGNAVRLYPPEMLVTVTYAILYARFALYWLKRRRVWDAALGDAGRALLYLDAGLDIVRVLSAQPTPEQASTRSAASSFIGMPLPKDSAPRRGPRCSPSCCSRSGSCG
jgi:hypothetical protein